MSCSIPDDTDPLKQLVLRVQTHKCVYSCFKDKSKKCRFGFPHNCSSVTKVLSEEEMLASRGRFVSMIRRKHEVNTNYYNRTILKLWTANMDIQPVGSMFGVVSGD